MAVSNTGYPARGQAARIAARLAGHRWIVVAAAALVGLLHATGTIAPGLAILILVFLVALIGLFPRPRADRLATPTAPAAAAGLEPGLGLFAEALPDPCFILDRRGFVRYANARAVATFPIGIGEALTFRLRVPDLVAAFDSVAKGGPPVRIEFGEPFALPAGAMNGDHVEQAADLMMRRLAAMLPEGYRGAYGPGTEGAIVVARQEQPNRAGAAPAPR